MAEIKVLYVTRTGHSRALATPIDDPGLDLSGTTAIVLVQPVWASAVCPPLRSWLRAHQDELAGKKLALIASNKGSEGAPLRAKFEAEFGPLAAFAVVAERLEAAEKAKMLERIGSELAR